jgi:hypothetical protein
MIHATDFHLEFDIIKKQAGKVTVIVEAGADLSRDEISFLISHIKVLEYQLSRANRTIKDQHEKYAHEGGKPQIMTIEILRRWLSALDIPIVTDVYQTNAPNVFYATFALPLYEEHYKQIRALDIEIIDPNSRLRNRYMLTWRPPRNDELYSCDESA